MSGRKHFTETIAPGVEVRYAADRVLHHEAGAHQDLALFENESFGRVLMLDGVTQVTTADEFAYHEMLAHVPLLAHGAAKDVLIVGGGDCGLAEEVLKHAAVRRLTQVEIDPAVVDFARDHFAQINAPVFADTRFALKIADGARFVAETEKRFDVVLVDSTDPHGPGAVLFSDGFYCDIRRCLKPGGVLAAQCGVPFLQRGVLVDAATRLASVFADVTAYVAVVPSYFGGHMALGFASDDADLRATPLSVLEQRFAAAGLQARYYTPEVHAAAFALPRFIRDAVEEARLAAGAG